MLNMDSGRRPAHAKGTVLGLLLFLTYISVTYPMQSDIPVLDSLQTNSLLYRGTKDRHDQALLQEDMDSLG